MNNTEHFLYAPSAAHRWTYCAGSIVYDYFDESEGSKEAKEGTFAHEKAAICLKDKKNAMDLKDVPEEMSNYIQEYLNYCTSLRPMTCRNSVTFIEQKLDLEKVYGLSEEIKEYLRKLKVSDKPQGTSDFIVYNLNTQHLYVIDLKYGKGVEVFAVGNKQGLIYCSGAMKLIKNIIEDCKISKIFFVIVQPRIKKKPDIWEIPVKYIEEIDMSLKIKFKKVHIEVLKCLVEGKEIHSKYFNPLGEVCKFCKGSGRCKHQDNYIQNKLQVNDMKNDIIQNAIDAIPDLSDEEIAMRLPVLDMLMRYGKMLWGSAHARLMQGRMKGLGWKLVLGKKPVRKWINKEKTEKELKRMKFKNDEMYKRELQTPKRIQDICRNKGKNLRWKRLQKLIDMKEAPLTIVSEDDSREDMTPKSLEDEFNKVNVIPVSGKGEQIEWKNENGLDKNGLNEEQRKELDELLNG
jgi:hypothetical protein